MENSKILTAVRPNGYSPIIIGTTNGIEPIAVLHIGRKKSKLAIIWRSIQRRNKIKKIWKIDEL